MVVKPPFHVISWSSRRLKRVARSSTSAETQMCANALDLHDFIKLSFLELESPKPLVLANSDLLLSRWKTCMIVDAKNVFDAVCKIETAGLQLEEKRTAIELLAIKQRLQQALVDLRWVNSDQQMSDALTKPWQHESLIRALQESMWRIVYDPSYQSAKRVRALKQSQQNPEMYALYCLWDLATETSLEARENFDRCEFLTLVCFVFDYPVASSTCLCMEMTVAIQAVCPFVPSIYDLCAIRKIDVASFYRGCLKAWLVIRSIILKREFDP